MKIKMLQTRRGSEDGFAVRQYHEGHEYDLAENLAKQFMRKGWAYNNEPIDDSEKESLRVPTNPETYIDLGKTL